MEQKSCMRVYLAQARERRGLSMRKTAMLAGITYQHYAMVEYGQKGARISFRTMCKIADVLNLSLDVVKNYEEKYQEDLGNQDY